MEKHPLHLKIPDLQTSDEVIDAVEKKERLTDEDLPNNPNDRIEAYIDRLENIFLNSDKKVRERNLEMLRPAIYDAFIIKPKNVPESFFELQKKVARERGQAVETIPQEMREQMIDVIIQDQKASLDSWIDYLTSDDAVYPPWFKYFVFRNIIKLSQFDKEIGKFKNRTDTTTAIFPDIFREPLAQICDLYEQVEGNNKVLKDKDIQTNFSRKFPIYYAELIQKSLANQIENKEEIKGTWVKYSQGNSEDAKKLYESLENKGTGWCTAGLSTAKAQIDSGDFYVYYTEVNGEPTQPRIAIRMEKDRKIAEIRGILPHQNLEVQMMPVLDEKLKEFGSEADEYKKKSADMKYLTKIGDKVSQGLALTKDDLVFLYEIGSHIDGFGQGRDPRVKEIIEKRDTIEDLKIILDISTDEVALSIDEINEKTKLCTSNEPINSDFINRINAIPHRSDLFIVSNNIRTRIVNLKDINFDELGMKDCFKFGNFDDWMHCSEPLPQDFEKRKVFCPDLSAFNGKPLGEVLNYVVETYGDTHYFPGIQYRNYLNRNEDKVDPILKEGNYWWGLICPGTLHRDNNGYWKFPTYNGMGSDRSQSQSEWLGYHWANDYQRIILLEK